VYRDLRQRGYIVKPSNVSDFAIYDTSGNSTGKNKSPKNRQIKYWSMAVSERTPFKIKEIRELIKTSKSTRKDLIIALVDEEGDLTYYIASTESPKGKTRSKPPKHKLTGSAVLIEDRVMLWDSELIKELREIGFYGKEVGSSLQLALTEAVYLMEFDVLEIRLARTRRKLSVDRFMHIAKKIQPDFDRRLMVYRELKSRHLIVKTGFKYGAHFRVYEGDPKIDHSEYLVHGIPSDFECSWEEISRAVRLAQGVRKLMLFSYIPNVGKKLEYINIERVKP
jgi:tRNA-intron endonuclease